jgi:hypothetical protein
MHHLLSISEITKPDRWRHEHYFVSIIDIRGQIRSNETKVPKHSGLRPDHTAEAATYMAHLGSRVLFVADPFA